ncbi:M81 family metallopeptidase [Paraburkholderia youngii]|uniref:M81 family metallopeptidase n=1 Tax=Paraburkholderia youngii TaxID=2782701 RepID=UPI00158FDEA3|nr:M81 family metallopeptidase [Paraburkholderia youngii]NUX57654.1 M81 family metallopeptidase [Paraburkholderia youngii]
MIVFACGISHESHSFSKLRTEISDFEGADVGAIDSKPELLDTRSTEGGILSAAQEFGWDLRFPFCAHATPSGPLAEEAFETLVGRLLGELKRAKAVDGVLLALHGAMFAEHVPDCEGEILERVRAVVGPRVPIAITLDLHANFSDRMAALSNIATSFRTTPHTDQWETSNRAARLLNEAMHRGTAPHVYVARLPMLAGMDMGRTIDPTGPMNRLLAMARKLELETPGVLDISLNAGFYYGDVFEAGPSVTVTAHCDDASYGDLAKKIMLAAWETRSFVSLRHYGVDEAIARTREVASGVGPVILVDYTDGPAGGAYGDGTQLLSALLVENPEKTVVGPIYDPLAVDEAIKAGVGASVRLMVGGRIDPAYGGPPVEVFGEVVRVSDGNYLRKGPYATGTTGHLGQGVCVKCGNVSVILVSRRQQPEDREQYRIFGIDPERLNILACKGINHFRADFEPISRELIFVDSGGLVSVDFTRFPFRNVRRPVWPLDDDVAPPQ